MSHNVTIAGRKIRRPIIIVGFSRTGTSLIAGIIARHGAWTGICRKADKFNQKGYFENIEITKIIKVKKRTGFIEKVLNILDVEGYTDGPWLVKHYLRKWDLWKQFKPYYLIPVRDEDAVIQSFNRMVSHGVYSEGNLRRKYRKIMKKAERVAKVHGGVFINSENIVNGDYSEIAEFMAKAGMVFNPKIADRFIVKGYWHYGNKAKEI